MSKDDLKSVKPHAVGKRDIEAYTHDDKTRLNNPLAGLAAKDRQEDSSKTYSFDPHISPELNWAGKAEGLSFSVPTLSIHIHESIKPLRIISSVKSDKEEPKFRQRSLFETTMARLDILNNAITFYQHGVDWTNRLIAGDSLVVMNSLLEKEGMAGQVQMAYIDPPYGIKYGSNFQPFVGEREVKDGKDEDLTQEPETIKAFRDTWELGTHSYLTYLRNRLLLTRDLLAESGSVFVQISDENIHHVREICDEVFGSENFISQILFQTTGGFSGSTISRIGDLLCWYAKDKNSLKYHPLYVKQYLKPGDSLYNWIVLPDGTQRSLNKEEKEDTSLIPKNAIRYKAGDLQSQGASSAAQPFEYNGKTYYPAKASHWKTTDAGLKRLAENNRIHTATNSIRYRRFTTDFPYSRITNLWTDTSTGSFLEEKTYVVQTGVKVISRCLLMTTDPGDLVLDITCGSGTTAYAAEQWGRRWITCDTSRVAIALAKKRLMTATYDYYRLKDEKLGVSGGFKYRTVKHITLKSIANGEEPELETLYDQPETDKTKIRVSGPFTAESLPAPVVKPLDAAAHEADIGNEGKKRDGWRDELLAAGIIGRGGARLEFSRVEHLPGYRHLHAEAETKEPSPRRAVICFAGETKPLDARKVQLALDEATHLHPLPQLLVFAAFQFDPEAADIIESTKWDSAIYGSVTLLKSQMNADLMTDDLKKKRSSNESFWLIGQPDVELIRVERGKDKFQVRVRGFDYYNVKTGTVESGNDDRIAMWMLDSDYDGMCFEPVQVFFPLGGKTGGWSKLAKTLKAEINQELIKAYSGTESLPFTLEEGRKAAVKIIDDRGIESLKVLAAEA
ncbi:MAG: site-specific DNA-methyltransferase [Deltaproteobacteria bacterium]|nr:site-specific DNA-methyltransferase [Deltaproteobacteria bacterium]